ncbi:MAG: cell division protein, partial [Pacificimonas sp.]
RFAVIAALGTAIGFLVGLVIIVVIGGLLGSVGNGLMAGVGLPWWGWTLLVSIPIAAILLTVATARITVERRLANVL